MRLVDSARQHPYIPLLIVLVAAAFLRVSEPGMIRYEYDEMKVTILAKDMVAGRDFPLEGIISSVGIPNTAMTVYITAIPFLITSNPLYATLFIALYNAVGVGLLWGFVKRYIGATPAFFAGLVYAVNPWAIMFSRKIWAQSLLATPVILFFWLGMLGFVERKRWAQVLCLPVLAIVAQIHYSGALLVPAYAWFLWHGRRDLSWRALLVSVLISGILVLPFAAAVLQFDDDDWSHYENIIDSKASRRQITDVPFKAMDRLITGLYMERWWTPRQPVAGKNSIDAPALLWKLLTVATLAGGAMLVRQPAYRKSLLPVALWIGLPVGLFALGWTRLYIHYFLYVIPAAAVLIGVCVGWLVTQRFLWLRGLTLVVLTLIVATQIRGWYGLLDFVDTYHTPNGMGTPIHYLMDPRDRLARYDDVLIVNDSSPWVWRSMLLNEIGSVRETTLAFGGELIVEPEGGFAVIAPIDKSDHIYHSDTYETFLLRPNEGGYRIDYFDNGFVWADAETIIPIDPVQFDNGVRLVGYAQDQRQTMLAWQLPAARSDTYQYFAHCYDSDGNRIAQVDGPFWIGGNWRLNDHIYIRFPLEWPEETAFLRVGLYQLTDQGIVNNHVLNAAGVPVQQWFDIPID